MRRSRKYEKTHTWITFQLDLRRLHSKTWMLLGEMRSKCEHLSQVPLKPSVAEALQRMFLAKGVQATTAIEGNTLSEEQVLARIDASLPPENYLEQEVENLMDAINIVADQTIPQPNAPLTPSEIKAWNRAILKDLLLEKEVVPGEIRQHEVGVGHVYLGAPAQDCEWLLEKLCEWLNSDDFLPKDDPYKIPMAFLRAVIGHLYFAWIHPFGDGNGRTARLLEFRLLVAGGIPAVAAHLLSNHYNLTRREYYARLNEASRSGGDVIPFIEYAVEGFVKELKEQLKVVWHQQWLLAWRDFVHERLGDEDKVSRRRRHLVLDLATHSKPVSISELTLITPRVAHDYASVHPRTVGRDLDALVSMGLIRQDGSNYIANVELILAFRSARAQEKADQ